LLTGQIDWPDGGAGRHLGMQFGPDGITINRHIFDGNLLPELQPFFSAK